MRTQSLLLLFLILTPTLACFKINPPKDEYQGVEVLNFTLETNLTDETAYLDTVELIFDRYMNLTSLGTGTCADEQGDLCKRVSWKFSELPVSDEDEIPFTFIPDFCLKDGTNLNVDIIVYGKCPVSRYERRVYSDAFTSSQATGPVCGELHQVEAMLTNVSIYSYYRPIGGNATLYISGPGHDEIITNFNEYCSPNACGLYEWHTNKTGMSFGFRVCANATYSELTVGQGQESVRAWWKFVSFNKVNAKLSKSIRVQGRPKIQTIQIIPENVLEQQNLVFKAGVTATCGDIDKIEIGLSTKNITCEKWSMVKKDFVTQNVTYYDTCEVLKVTSPNVTLSLNNSESKWAEFSIYTLIQGQSNFEVYGTYKNSSAFRNTTNLTVGYNPLGCDSGFQRCGTSCKPVPNCTRPCSLGLICDEMTLRCMYRQCGTPCPNQPGKYCDGQGYCLPPQLQGYPCDCRELCLPSYLEGDVCLYSSVCDGVCRYLTKICTGICTSHGCCGDSVCDQGENCEACPGDCTCNDNNDCTMDTCSHGVCMHENHTCGVTCPEGVCDGFGLCRADACCSDKDCETRECKTGTCHDYTCQFELFTCTSCSAGWCSDGNCLPSLNFDEECECGASCGPDMACMNGRCSYCGNTVCSEGECFSCIQDCEIGVCAEMIWDEHGIKIVIGGILLIFIVLYLKKVMPDLKEALRKSKPPPDNY